MEEKDYLMNFPVPQCKILVRIVNSLKWLGIRTYQVRDGENRKRNPIKIPERPIDLFECGRTEWSRKLRPVVVEDRLGKHQLWVCSE